VGYYQPLGILYVATYLVKDQSDLEVKVIDAASPDMPYSQLRSLIAGFMPDVIGISTYTHTFIDALTISRIAKKLRQDIHVTMGGHHLSYFAKETLHHRTVDSVIIGEGEFKFARLIKNIRYNLPLEEVDGVFTRHNQYDIGAYKKTDHFLPDISDLPFPDRSLVEGYQYGNMLTSNRRMTTIISSRGCPFNCTFCPQGREPYRPRSSQDVVDEIEDLHKKGYTDFFFAEDTFNISKKKVLDFCNELMGRGLNVGWCCKARISGMNYETLSLMRKAGCYLINFGVETGTDEGLIEIQKETNTAQIRQVFDWCRKVGIQTMAYFMIGHPFEKTKRDIHNNISFLISLNADYCNINSVNPTPFTPLFDKGVQKGILSYAPWRTMVLTGKMFTPANWEEHLSKKEIQRLRNISILRFYFRPSYILFQLRNTINSGQLLFKVKIATSMLLSFFLKG